MNWHIDLWGNDGDGLRIAQFEIHTELYRLANNESIVQQGGHWDELYADNQEEHHWQRFITGIDRDELLPFLKRVVMMLEADKAAEEKTN